MKPGPNFKMAKSTKRMLATVIDPHKRGLAKRGMIDAQLSSQVIMRREKNAKR